jgi:hypothetical protein
MGKMERYGEGKAYPKLIQHSEYAGERVYIDVLLGISVYSQVGSISKQNTLT